MSSDYMPPSPEPTGSYDPSRPLGGAEPPPHGAETYAPPPTHTPPAGGYAAPQGYYGTYAPPPGPMAVGNSGYAIASLILSILGIIFVLPVIGTILGIIFGHLSLNEIKNANGQLEGRGMAMAGLIIGYVTLGLGLLLACLFISVFAISATQ